MNTTKKPLSNVTCCFFVAFFFPIQTVVGSGYYGIESPLPYNMIKKLDLFSSLSVRS